MRRIKLRTPEERADQNLSWARADEDFFASGACHVLTAAFFMTYPTAGFSPWGLVEGGGRVVHVVAVREGVVFDASGYSSRVDFLAEYTEAMRVVRSPDWSADFQPLDADPIGWDFCRARDYRHPTQFAHDPVARAVAFVRRFPSPSEPR